MLNAVPLQTLPAELAATEQGNQANNETLQVIRSQRARGGMREETDVEANLTFPQIPMASRSRRCLDGKSTTILLSLFGIIVTGVTIWPSYASMRDGHKQLQLALWTAQWEYAKYCTERVRITSRV